MVIDVCDADCRSRKKRYIKISEGVDCVQRVQIQQGQHINTQGIVNSDNKSAVLQQNLHLFYSAPIILS